MVRDESRLRRLVLRLTALLLSLAFVGLLGAALLYARRSHLLVPTYPLTVTFRNAQGVEAGAPVKMAGVTIGHVERTGLNGQEALLSLRIEDSARIPRGSRFVALPLLLNLSGSVEVIPPDNSAGKPVLDALRTGEPNLQGEAAQGLPEALRQTQAVLSGLPETTQKTAVLLDESTRAMHRVNALLADDKAQRDVQQTLANTRRLSDNGVKATQQMTAVLAQTRSLLAQAQAPSKTLLTNLADVSAEARRMARTSRPQIMTILADVQQTTSAASELVAKGNDLIARCRQVLAQGNDLIKNEGLDKQWALSMTNLADTAANARSITEDMKALSEKMNGIAANVQTLTADPQVRHDIKDTLENLRGATEKLNGFAASAQSLLNDPAVPIDLKATLHTLRELSETSKTLLEQLSKAAGKK